MVSDAGITISEDTMYAPKKRGQWNVQEVAEYSEKNEQQNTMEEARKQEMGRRNKEMAKKGDTMGEADERYYKDQGMKGLMEASRLYNREISGANENQVGELETILVDVETGTIKMVVLEHGSFFGLMGDQYLIPWQAVHFDKDSRQINLRVSEDNLDTYSQADDVDEWDGSTMPKDMAVKMYEQYDYEYES